MSTFIKTASLFTTARSISTISVNYYNGNKFLYQNTQCLKFLTGYRLFCDKSCPSKQPIRTSSKVAIGDPHRCSSTRHNGLKKTKAVIREKIIGMRENVMTYPNGLSLMRIALTPVLSFCILNQYYVSSLSLFAVAGITDILDGYIARNFPNQKSILGSVLDPLADKFLIATLFLSLTAVDMVPTSLTLLVIMRDIVLIMWSMWVRFKSLPEPKSAAKFFDVTLATAEIKPSLISKVNTGVQLAVVTSAISAPVLSFVGHPLLPVLYGTAAVTTLWSGIGYIVAGGSYKFIRRKLR